MDQRIHFWHFLASLAACYYHSYFESNEVWEEQPRLFSMARALSLVTPVEPPVITSVPLLLSILQSWAILLVFPLHRWPGELVYLY